MSKMKLPKNLGGYLAVDRMQLEDIQFLDQLTPEQSDWYNRFLDNFYNARSFKDGKDVITSKEEMRELLRLKAHRRLTDFYSKTYVFDREETEHGVVKHYGTQLLIPKPVIKQSIKTKKKKVKSQIETSPVSPNTKVETLDEYLARGGKISTVQPTKK